MLTELCDGQTDEQLRWQRPRGKRPHIWKIQIIQKNTAKCPPTNSLKLLNRRYANVKMSNTQNVDIRTNLFLKLIQILYICDIKTAKFYKTERKKTTK